MAKEVIILDTNAQDGAILQMSALFWFAAPAGKERPTSGGSQWTGASQAEHDAIRAGTVIEESRTLQVPKSMTAAQIKAYLLSIWTDRQAYLASLPTRGQYYGVFYDGVNGWSA
jgi:hypothetical protein